MKPTGVNQAAVTGGNKVKIRPVQDSLPWHKKALSPKSSFIDPKQRTLLQTASSLSKGQLIGGAVAGLGILDAAYNIFFKKDDSTFFRKYIFPLVTFVLGVVGVKSSSPPKDAYLANMLRTGVTDFIRRAQGFLKGKNIFQALKELSTDAGDEKQNKLLQAASWTLESAWPALIRSLPADDTDNEFINALRNIQPDDGNIVGDLKQIIAEHGEEVFYDFIKSNPMLLREVLKELAQENYFRENLNDLVAATNEIIEPSGLAFDLSYNTEENLINVCLRSTSCYARPGEKEVYNPVFVTTIRPEFILTAMKFVQQSFKDEGMLRQKVEELRELTGGQLNPKLVKELTSAHATNELTAAIGISVSLLLAMADSSGKARAGFFKVNPKTGERTSGKPDVVNLTLDGLFSGGYLPHPVTLIKMWKKGNTSGEVSKNHDYEFSTGGSHNGTHKASRTDAKAAIDVEFLPGGVDDGPIDIKVHNGFESPPAKDVRIIGFPHNEEEAKLPRYLNFLGFNFASTDSNEIIRLKVCLVKALINTHSETRHWKTGDDKTDYFVQVMLEIEKRLGQKISDLGNTSVEKGEKGYKIPQDLANLNYFFKSLELRNIEYLEDYDINSAYQLLYLVDETQSSILKNELEVIEKSST